MSGPTPTPALSGKALALARRRDQAQRGGRAQPPSTGAQSVPRTGAATRAEPVSESVAVTAPVRMAEPVRDFAPVATATASSASATNGRDLARARRAAQARTGVQGRPSGRVRSPGAATAPTVPAVAATASLGTVQKQTSHAGHFSTSPQPLSNEGRGARMDRSSSSGSFVSVRELARQRRAELGKNGRSSAPDSRPSGRVRPPAPAKVEIGTTLSGGTVTGTLVDRNPKVTGNEPGTCRTITGTEYIGAEQFDQFCGARPAPPVPKVGLSATGQGQRLTGTEIGRSPRVTGDESGTCRSVTGTEYLGSEILADFCPGSTLPARPAKVAIGTTERKGLVVTGTDEARAAAVTGAEAGVRRTVTGSQYADAGLARLTINGPPSRVALTHTLAGRPVSGTEVGRSVKVTGDEAGACRPVSGTEYLSNEQFQTICRTRPEPAPPKVGVSQTERGQWVSGVLPGRSPLVTGNEPGSASAITGTPYGEGPRLQPDDCACGCGGHMAADQETPAVPMVRRTPRDLAPAVQPMPYAEPGPADFSIVSPARAARGHITGNALGSAGGGGSSRITGPVNLAAGLVSGTPEFRYRDELPTHVRAPAAAAPLLMEEAAGRITGEGRDSGRRITGDDWTRSGRVTGTEGHWAQGRNPTLRGESRRPMRVGAWGNRDLERPEPAPSARVTGSSGGQIKGTSVTYSGGARG